MSPSAKLTEQEKQNGKRRLLIPSEEIQELMQRLCPACGRDTRSELCDRCTQVLRTGCTQRAMEAV